MIDRTLVRYPLLFQDNRIERFYIGGKLLNQWRKAEAVEDSHMCEELLATSIGAISKGKEEGFAISRTMDGERLSDILRAYPEEVLGKAFHQYNPGQLTVLARAGDTKVRLVMQCHPRRADAKRYFQMHMGKCEAWYIARTREVEGGNVCVYAGFQPHVTKALWKELIARQDIPQMLACLHQIPVEQGQTVLIPAGMPHCVGPGCLFLEFHECNDVTVRVEKNINQMEISDSEMFCGLEMEDGLELFDYTVYTEEEIKKKVIMKARTIEEQEDYTVQDLIGREDNDTFGIQLVTVNGSYQLPEFDGHRILVPVENDLTLEAGGRAFHLVQGHAALIPAACRGVKLTGEHCKVTIGIPLISEEEA